jgi:uncharacterized protein (TIGR02453 family)
VSGSGRATYFTTNTFRFLLDLKDNNERAWFAEHKPRYEEHLKAPALRLIEDFAPLLAKISERFTASPRSLYRIHKDTRFSRDKSPYKTYVGLHFRHERAKDAHAPGYYLHVEPGNVFAGVGIWHPDSDTLRRIREHLVEHPDDWKRAARGKGFKSVFELEGDKLSRPPRGFDANHALIDDLKWKDYIGVAPLDEAFVRGARVPKDMAEIFAAGTPFMRFLCDALDLPF